MQIENAMILAAGFGKRMLPLTEHTPKPLVQVSGRALIDYSFDLLLKYGIKRVVVNTHYHADMLASYVRERYQHICELIIIYEKELLETGGGIVNAMPYFDGKPFFTLNSDLINIGANGQDILKLMSDKYHADMQALLLLYDQTKAYGFQHKGDFALFAGGKLGKILGSMVQPYEFVGIHLFNPELFKNPPGKIFSNKVWYETNEEGIVSGLYGIEYSGTCIHVGTPSMIKMAEEILAKQNNHDLV